jgi:DNA repair exonuclease SbcCD ATPase subunit
MNQNGGFVDLRLNRDENRGNESFWPSFTDIMTVVVMIFLISMVVVLLRNMELVKELRHTLQAEREAMALARAAGQEKQNISAQLEAALEQLGAADQRIAELESRVKRLQEQNEVRTRAIADRDQQLQTLLEERNDLAQRAAELQMARDAAEKARRSALEQRQQALQELERLRQERRDLDEELARKSLQVTALQSKLQLQEQQLAQARQERQSMEDKYLQLAGEYDSLKVRYDRLVRPARSPRGHYLVEVRYYKRKGRYHIDWRQGGEGEFKAVSRKQLERILSRLKQSHPEGLYVKVILPKNNGLSFSEAWSFTNRLHRAYDYYYQEPPPEAPETDESSPSGEEAQQEAP